MCVVHVCVYLLREAGAACPAFPTIRLPASQPVHCAHTHTLTRVRVCVSVLCNPQSKLQDQEKSLSEAAKRESSLTASLRQTEHERVSLRDELATLGGEFKRVRQAVCVYV
jgi:hypothetical protein